MADHSASRWPASTATSTEYDSYNTKYGEGHIHAEGTGYASNLQAVSANANESADVGGDSPDDFYRNYGGQDDQALQSKSTTASRSTYQRPNGGGLLTKYPPVTTQAGADDLNMSKSADLSHITSKPRQTSGTIQEKLRLFESKNNTSPPKVPGKIPIPRSSGNLPTSLYERSVSEAQSASYTRPGEMTRNFQARANSPSAMRSTQRTRFSPEDQHSNNALSSAARSQRSVAADDQSHGRYFESQERSRDRFSKPVPTSSSDSNALAFKQPLFGEVVPTNGDLEPGYGISDVRPRSNSEAGLQVPPNGQNSGSTSPTDWYRTNTNLLNTPRNTNARSHTRSQSASRGEPYFRTKTSAIPRYGSSSRLPGSSHRPSASSDFTNLPSSRNTSPSGSGRASSLANKRAEQRALSPSARSVTPTGRPHTRQGRSPGKGGVKAIIQDTTQLQKSPPLRNSRDRSSVATATTASSRSRAVPKSSPPRDVRTGRAPAVDENKRYPRNGAIDYGASRARVKEGVRERIEESLRKHAVNDKIAVSDDTEFENLTVVLSETANPELDSSSAPKPESSSHHLPPPIQISQSLGADSPTLGLPGSFPITPGMKDDDSRSFVSDMTEFDVEPQTDAPNNLTAAHNKDVPVSSPKGYESDSIHIMLDEASLAEDQMLHNGLGLNPSQPVSKIPHSTTGAAAHASSTIASDSDYNTAPPTSLGHEISSNSKITNDVPLYRSILDSRNDGVEEDEINPTYSGSRQSQHFLPMPRLQTQTLPVAAGDTLDTPATVFEENNEDTDVAEPINSHIGSSSMFSQQLDRLSQQSSWTGYSSRESEDGPAYSKHPDHAPPLPPPAVRSRSPKPAVPPKPVDYSPQPSPRNNFNVTPSNNRLSTHSYASYGSSSYAPPNQDYTSPATRKSSQPDTASISSRHTQPTSQSSSRPPSTVESSLQGSTITGDNDPDDEMFRSMSKRLMGRKQPLPEEDSQAEKDAVRKVLIKRRRSTLVSVAAPLVAASAHSKVTPQVAEQGQPGESIGQPLTEEQKEHLVQRLWAIKELVDSEALFLKDMHVFEEIYKGTADVCPTLTAEHVELLFRNIGGLVAFTTTFLDDLKSGVSSIYSVRSKKESPSSSTDGENYKKFKRELTDDYVLRDRQTTVAATIKQNLDNYQLVYSTFLGRQMEAAALLHSLKGDVAVGCWLGECNAVAKDLTAAWDIDSLWSKPLQRLSKLPLLIISILKHTPEDHPEYEGLRSLKIKVEDICETVNKSIVASTVPRSQAQQQPIKKRKESATAKSLLDKLKRTPKPDNATPQDEDFNKAHEKYCNDYFELQVVLRDIEGYSRSTAEFVNQFLKYLASIELVVRSGNTSSALEQKWIGFSASMGTIEKEYLANHLNSIKSRVLDPIEFVLKVFANSETLIKKRKDMIPAHVKYMHVASQKKKVDDKLEKAESEYQKLNSELKGDFYKFGQLCKEIGTLCLARFVNIMCLWYSEWLTKMNEIFEGRDPATRNSMTDSFNDIVDSFEQKYATVRDLLPSRPNDSAFKNRNSQSSQPVGRDSGASADFRAPSFGSRPRGPSGASESLPRTSNLSNSQYSGSNNPVYTASPISTVPQEMPHYDTRDPRYNSRPNSSTPVSPEIGTNSGYWGRPSTGRSQSSGAPSRSYAGNNGLTAPEGPHDEDWFAPHINESFGLFSSAMPMDEASAEPRKHESMTHSRQQSRTSSSQPSKHGGQHLRTMYMAASLFEFHFDGTKTEAGYPYLTYPAGDIFDVIAEKGELWLARNNEDKSSRVGWIWSKHFAKFASSPEDAMPTDNNENFYSY